MRLEFYVLPCTDNQSPEKSNTITMTIFAIAMVILLTLLIVLLIIFGRRRKRKTIEVEEITMDDRQTARITNQAASAAGGGESHYEVPVDAQSSVPRDHRKTIQVEQLRMDDRQTPLNADEAASTAVGEESHYEVPVDMQPSVPKDHRQTVQVEQFSVNDRQTPLYANQAVSTAVVEVNHYEVPIDMQPSVPGVKMDTGAAQSCQAQPIEKRHVYAMVNHSSTSNDSTYDTLKHADLVEQERFKHINALSSNQDRNHLNLSSSARCYENDLRAHPQASENYEYDKLQRPHQSSQGEKEEEGFPDQKYAVVVKMKTQKKSTEHQNEIDSHDEDPRERLYATVKKNKMSADQNEDLNDDQDELSSPNQ